MRKRILKLVAIALGAMPAVAQVQPITQEVRDAVEAQLHLADFTIQRLDVPAEHMAFAADLTLGGLEYEVWVEPHSFRTETATGTAVGEGGVIREIPLPPPLTVRAQLEEAPEARAAGSRFGGGLHLAVFFPGAGDAELWTVQPLYDVIPGADPALHVVHKAEDVVVQEEWRCGVDDIAHGEEQHADPAGGGGTRSFLACELACEADWEYYGLNGSNEANVIADIDTVIARIALVYEGQCNVTFVIPHYNIWTTSSDPYTSTDPGTRLGQFRNWWNANKGGVNRDLAHAFTGANLNGSVIGIAYLSAVCGSNGYGMVQSKYTSGMNSRGALSAHEIGHNFSAGHCDGNGDCHIMCSGLGGCDRLGNPARFGQPSATKITNYAANRPCLDESGIPFPFLEEWTETTINDVYWVAVSGAVVDGNGDNEPSEPYSVNLDGADSIESGSIDISGSADLPYVSFFTQHKGVESGETLIAEYRDLNGNWQELDTIASDGSSQTQYAFHIYRVDFLAWGPEFAIRFRGAGNDGTDDWYIDDIAVGPFTGRPIPFEELFADSALDTATVWETVAGATVSADATNEPSGPYSMNLDGTDSAATFNFLMSEAPFPTYFSFFTQHKGVENGKTLVAEYFDFNSNWAEFMTITSDGADQNAFEFHQGSFIFDAYHDQFRVRFRAQGADGSDDWYVDDVRLGDEFTPPDDCVADFNEDGIVNTQDVLAFLNAWNAGDPKADINGDGTINTQDVLAYLNLWNAGCD